jgi:integrase/recombinase XerC
MSKIKFLEYLEFEKNYSPKTIESYTNDLNAFETFCEIECGLKSISEADKTHLRNFIMRLSESGLSERSINRKISAIKSYYKFLLKTGEIPVSPASFLRTLKSRNKVQIPFSEDELNTALNSGLFENNKQSMMEKLIIEMLYQTGIRRMELIGLKISDVDFSENQIKVLGKRNKERMIPFNENLAGQLKQYLQLRNEKFPERKDLVFLTEKGNPLYDKLVYKIVNSYLSQVSTKRKKSPHVLRHSFATHLLGRGAELNAVKELLGHSSLAATQVYTHAGIEQLKKVFNDAHPRSEKNNQYDNKPSDS